jgi:hypothetical protein
MWAQAAEEESGLPCFLALTAIGVVFGDIGTSPPYTLSVTLPPAIPSRPRPRFLSRPTRHSVPAEATHSLLCVLMSDDINQRRGGRRIGVNGSSKLVLAPRDYDDLNLVGQWPRERLEQMDAAFVARVEWAFRFGRESRHSAGAVVMRPYPGDADRWIA